jgi:hypothetical protein
MPFNASNARSAAWHHKNRAHPLPFRCHLLCLCLGVIEIRQRSVRHVSRIRMLKIEDTLLHGVDPRLQRLQTASAAPGPASSLCALQDTCTLHDTCSQRLAQRVVAPDSRRRNRCTRPRYPASRCERRACFLAHRHGHGRTRHFTIEHLRPPRLGPYVRRCIRRFQPALPASSPDACLFPGAAKPGRPPAAGGWASWRGPWGHSPGRRRPAT